MNDDLGNDYPNKLRFVNKNTWSTAPVSRDDMGIMIQGRYVMEKWQEEYMRAFALAISNAVRAKGDWLEIGFGLGLFARALHKMPVRNFVADHYIIEPNKEIFKDIIALNNKLSHDPTSSHKIVPVLGMWQDVIDNGDIFRDDSFEAVFFDGSPFDMEELIERQFDFGEHAYRLLKPGGIYSYCNLTGFGTLRTRFNSWEDFYYKSQYHKLESMGYVDIAMKLVSVTPPKNNEKYRYSEAPVLLARKPY